ncbi:MAG: aminodeoxychorismate/anthranilate synthase component II [Clostridia bacterium]|nr:aminodeoxychorismate/anthranilate synthase component II [Clostridia bacterium]
MILLLDNCDSFTYNLAQYLWELGADVVVRRDDEVGADDVAALEPEAVVVSPGPGRPEDHPTAIDVIRRLGGRTPILGVCLGLQAIARAYGGRVVRAKTPVHGRASRVSHDGQGVFRGLPSPLVAGRYHSLAVADAGLPAALAVTARAEDGTVMGLRHREHPVEGVQFHPESVLTPEGKRLLANFLEGAMRA